MLMLRSGMWPQHPPSVVQVSQTEAQSPLMSIKWQSSPCYLLSISKWIYLHVTTRPKGHHHHNNILQLSTLTAAMNCRSDNTSNLLHPVREELQQQQVKPKASHNEFALTWFAFDLTLPALFEFDLFYFWSWHVTALIILMMTWNHNCLVQSTSVQSSKLAPNTVGVCWKARQNMYASQQNFIVSWRTSDSTTQKTPKRSMTPVAQE